MNFKVFDNFNWYQSIFCFHFLCRSLWANVKTSMKDESWTCDSLITYMTRQNYYMSVTRFRVFMVNKIRSLMSRCAHVLTCTSDAIWQPCLQNQQTASKERNPQYLRDGVYKLKNWRHLLIPSKSLSVNTIRLITHHILVITS